MKNQPHRHKDGNVFKFKSFNDIVSTINIRQNALYRIENPDFEDDQTNETHFHQSYLKWSVDNLSEEYKSFQKKISGLVTLQQLYHSKDSVAELILESLKTATTLSLQPLLDFVTSMAKDLQNVFYENFFPQFLKALMGLLNTKEPEQIEWTFYCLAHLFKILKKYLKKDLSIVYNEILPLLNRRRYPEYVTNYAAECFSYVARDIQDKDKDKFLAMLLNGLKKHVDGATDCGRLLYEVVKGASQGMHSCAKGYLINWLKSLVNPSIDNDLLFNVLTEFVQHLVQNVKPQNLDVFWQVSIDVIKELSDETSTNNAAIHNILILMERAMKFRNGKCLCRQGEVIENLLVLCDKDISSGSMLQVSKIVALILLSPNLTITQLDSSRLTKKVMNTADKNIFEHFVWQLVNWSQFEVLILPEFLKYFEKYFTSEPSAFELMTKIILEKSPLCHDGIRLGAWKVYRINFKSEETVRQIENIITRADLSDHYAMSLILYPHITGKDGLSECLRKTVKKRLEAIPNSPPTADADMAFFRDAFYLLAIIIETIIHLNQSEALDLQELTSTLLPYCNNENFTTTLQTLDQLLEVQPKEKLDFALFQIIHYRLETNLSSQSHDVRLLSAHIFGNFSHLEELAQSNESIYDIIYKCESVTSTVQTYRDQLMSLQKLSATMELFRRISGTLCRLDPLRYLLGVYHINFNLLWKPVSKLLAEYSTKLSATEFWPIFKEKLNSTTVHIRSPAVADVPFDANIKSTVLHDEFVKMWTLNDRTDYVNYRILLWRAMADCGQLVESKNREIVEIFLDFIDTEYNRENESGVWNLMSQSELNVDETEENEEGSKKDRKVSSTAFRSFVPMMSVFTKLVNPKQLYREKDMCKLYMNLLSHWNSNVQKIALDCLMAYKHPYLTAYKEQLYGIIDEKTFKKTMTSFKLHKDETVVVDVHRKDLMPILMRILFSKLTTKAPKGQGQDRKSLILRTLGGCTEDEILIILKMAFKAYERYLEDEPLAMVTSIATKIDMTSVVSAKKMTSTLNFIEIIREEIAGSKSPQFLRYLLNIMLTIGAMVQHIVDGSHQQINPSFLKMYKAIRTSCLKSVTNVFCHFEAYPWESAEIESIFHVFITPSLHKLSTESLQSPSQLLKLLHTFGKNPRYFSMLTKQPRNVSDDQTPIKYLFDLLLHPQSKPIVCRTVMEIIESLVTLADYQSNDENSAAPIPVDNCKSFDHTKSKMNYGSAILISFLPKILEKFQINLKKRMGLTRRDVLILSRCTELIEESELCSVLLKLILPILIRKSNSRSDEESLKQMVVTVSNLLEKVSEPERHIPDIAPMFQMMSSVEPRKLLCRLLASISKRAKGDAKEDLATMVRIVNELNAWNVKFIEQPDYDRRLEAYAEVERLQNAGKLTLNLGLLVIYHSFYFLRDSTMCDSASHNLQTMVPAMVRQFENRRTDVDFLIGNVILNLIRRNLNDSNENVWREGILLLGELARECPSAHPVLQDLQPLTNKQDREVDFFDNITHIQSHRHTRALLKFCSVAKTFDRSPNVRTLTQFILPLASQYVCKEKHATKHGIITAAIETIGVVCRLLPWYHYEMLLKHYLKKMRTNVDFQKQLVRLVMEILNQFHFDLSMAKIAPKELAKDFEKVDEVVENDAAKVVKEEEEREEDTEELVLVADNAEDDELNDKLLNEQEVDETEEVEESVAKKPKICAFDRQIVLSHNAAKRVVRSITTGLIPSLHNSITNMSTYESFHKLNKVKRRSEREEEEILRVPIALAMVKLLQKLPEGMLEHSIRGIFIKVCMFLKSPLKSVRLFTRNILKNIMQNVGTKYLAQLMSQMTSMLTRGFQVHVLTVTMYGVLDVLKHTFKAGEIDGVLQSILSVCLEDIFGQTSEEKEVKKIAGQTPEAKPSNCSFQSLNIAAVNITESCMLDLVLPLKTYLLKSQSKKVVTKVQNCCQTIAAGLVQNKNIPLESLLTFIYGTSSESIQDLFPTPAKAVSTQSEKEKQSRVRPDCFLLPEQPKGRTGAVAKAVVTNVRANAHVIVEFGLSMLQIVLKRSKITKIKSEAFLNPIIPVLLHSLNSAHILVTISSLKCLTEMWNKTMELQKLTELTPAIVDVIYKILHKYATPGMATVNENFRLIKNAFGAMVAVIRNAKEFTVSEDQLRTLLAYIDQNIADSSSQVHGFTMLKVVLDKQLVVKEIHDIMRTISEMAITSESQLARTEAKRLLINYLMNYPLGKKIDGYFNFFVTNLNYETISGRDAAIQILHKIVNRFPQNIVNEKSAFLFVWLGTRLVNDESPDCRQAAAACIESLIGRCDKEHKDKLFDVVLEMLQDNKNTHIELGAMLCSRFVAAEKLKFVERIGKVLPLLIATLPLSKHKGPGQYVLLPKVDVDDDESDDEIDEDKLEFKQQQKERSKDHQIIQVTNAILKILEDYQSKMSDFLEHVDQLAYEAQKLLGYEHVWVRINAAKILGFILSQIDLEQLKACFSDENAQDTELKFLYSNPSTELKSLSLDLCAQLIPDATDEEMADEVIKNLLYVANMIKDIPLEKQSADEEQIINLHWLIRRMRYVIHAEVAKVPHITILRTAAFHWIEGLIALLPETTIGELASYLMAPLVREMSEEDKNIEPKMRQLALKVGNTLKQQIGDAQYQILKTRLLTKLMLRRAERKKVIAQVKVDDPVRASLRKAGERSRKKVAKKRKMDVLKGRALPKKKKRKIGEDDDLF
ncbi:Small subunit processome component 20 like [Pseudolycoriella hygida]|uniref:Small subunit processome component 20 like n=1 Tax=Pseudolycoriella hygida TaxID=35572 RepID=A0A9Q0N4L9_9DIPT|nr:Small subunit processome component 20 like [Pseudolycoriella hygida]